MTASEITKITAAVAGALEERMLHHFQIMPMLTLDQTAQALGISHEKVRLLCENKELPFIRINKLYRIKPADVNAYLEKHYCKGKADAAAVVQ